MAELPDDNKIEKTFKEIIRHIRISVSTFFNTDDANKELYSYLSSMDKKLDAGIDDSEKLDIKYRV